ncbi:hypothetical protein RB2654_15175 [Rhodobacterales bacterium HTCC2654]|uniref:Uncharacterized protein n=1 Tax=Maritimibacter alkaliphilus HTCC2654 TaxID=314271 RepID=A3VH84_9RHOB|nr:hypothetical protein RB2654_15175 [Rhodobacterales bacterium HTCC2654] [Maritimibacter alkaliphilus HTCC2654]
MRIRRMPPRHVEDAPVERSVRR